MIYMRDVWSPYIYIFQDPSKILNIDIDNRKSKADLSSTEVQLLINNKRRAVNYDEQEVETQVEKTISKKNKTSLANLWVKLAPSNYNLNFAIQYKKLKTSYFTL